MENEWSEWERVFIPDRDPSAVFFVALRSRGVFHLLDVWRGTKHTELADFILSVVLENQLSGMMSPNLTPQGAPVGDHYQSSRLIGAFGTKRLKQNQKIIDVGLALVFLAVLSNPEIIDSHWIEELCGACHNNASSNWQQLLPLCSLPPHPLIFPAVLAWAVVYSRQPSVTGRNLEDRFRSAISQTGKYLSGSGKSIGKRASSSGSNIFSFAKGRAGPEEEVLLPEVASREYSWLVIPDHCAEEEAEPPDTLFVVADDIVDPGEPEHSEEFASSAGIRTAFRSAFDNQRLRYHWDQFDVPPFSVARFFRVRG